MRKGVTHASSFPDGIGNTVNEAELGRQVELTLSSFHQEERLLGVGDPLLVGAHEVIRDRDFLI